MPLPLSVCFIVKNEEVNLPKALDSLIDIASEIIMVDTGSEDNTKAIAESYGAKIFDYKWNDSFAEARNEALKYATQEWILIFDADFTFEEYSKAVLGKYLKNNDTHLYYIQCIEDKDEFQHPLIFLFRNNFGIKFEGRIHEKVVFDNTKHKISFSDIYIRHYGYSEPDILNKKILRNQHLFEMSLKNDNLSEQAKIKIETHIILNEVRFCNEIHEITNKILEFNNKIKKSDFRESNSQIFEQYFVSCQNYFLRVKDFEMFFQNLIEGLKVFPLSINLLFQLSKWFYTNEYYYKSVETLNFILYLIKSKSMSCYIFQNKKELLNPDFIICNIIFSYFENGDYDACRYYIGKISNYDLFREHLDEISEIISGKKTINSIENQSESSFHYFRTARQYLRLNNIKESFDFFIKAKNLSEKEGNVYILLFVISDLILNSEVFDFESSFIQKIIEKGSNISHDFSYFWYALGKYYILKNDINNALKSFESAHKIETGKTDLIFNTCDNSIDFSQINFMISESKHKSYLYELIIKSIRKCFETVNPNNLCVEGGRKAHLNIEG